jgi:pyridoxine 5'-phosphate synthase PdxJ
MAVVAKGAKRPTAAAAGAAALPAPAGAAGPRRPTRRTRCTCCAAPSGPAVRRRPARRSSSGFYAQRAAAAAAGPAGCRTRSCSMPTPTRCRRWPRPQSRRHGPGGAARLRAALLRELGVLPDLDVRRRTQQPVTPTTLLRAGSRGRRARGAPDASLGLPGACAGRGIDAALAGGDAWAALRTRAAPMGAALSASVARLASLSSGRVAAAHARGDGGACSAHRTGDPMNPLVADEARPTPGARRHRVVGQRQQGGAAAQHAPPRHPERGARGPRWRWRRAPTASPCIRGPTSATSDGARRARPGRAAEAWPQAEYNIEGNPFHNLMEVVRAVRPHQATFVPDARASSPPTTAGTSLGRRAPAAADRRTATRWGARQPVHGPAPEAMALARAVGADRVELYTEPYAARTARRGDAGAAAGPLCRRGARRTGGRAWASTPVTTEPRQPHRLPAAVPGVLEVSIGHALVADALLSSGPRCAPTCAASAGDQG